MNENLDLTKILEGCPEGTKLYSPIYGEVSFVAIKKGCSPAIGVYVDNWGEVSFSPEGYYYRGGGDVEVVLFPSRTQRDWNKFERFWDKPKVKKFDPETFHPFDKVLVRNDEQWGIDFFGHPLEDGYIMGIGWKWKQCIPYNKETKHLVGKTDDCPEYYKWWEE